MKLTIWKFPLEIRDRRSLWHAKDGPAKLSTMIDAREAARLKTSPQDVLYKVAIPACGCGGAGNSYD